MPYRRIDFTKGRYYHIFNRGIDRQPIFREAENYLFALRKVKKYAHSLNIAIVAYCLMPNHYHLLVRQDSKKPAGRLPQLVFNSYTKAFNRRYRRSGTLFEGRYRAIHVDEDHYLIHLCRYIHANPVTGGLVSTPDAWPYSNFREWIGARDGTLIDEKFVGEFFASPEEYCDFVCQYLENNDVLPEGTEEYVLE